MSSVEWPLDLETCRRAQVESLRAERPPGRTTGTRIDSENVLSDKKTIVYFPDILLIDMDADNNFRVMGFEILE